MNPVLAVIVLLLQFSAPSTAQNTTYSSVAEDYIARNLNLALSAGLSLVLLFCSIAICMTVRCAISRAAEEEKRLIA
jgi:hypothetical protein